MRPGPFVSLARYRAEFSMKYLIGLAIAASMLAAATANAFAQYTPEEVRKRLGQPVELTEAMLLGSAQVSHRELCGGATKHEGHAELISRVQLSSLDPADRDRLIEMIARQHESNVVIFEALGESARSSFCRGLESTVLAKAAEFVTAHPHLFEKRTGSKPEPEPELKTFGEMLAEIMKDTEPFERFAIVRLAENFVMDDFRKIMAHPDNKKDGYLWARKVLAGDYALLGQAINSDHPDIGEVYDERSEIYVRHIRGEIDEQVMMSEERANERRKNALFKRQFKIYSKAWDMSSTSRVQEIEALAKALALQISAMAKNEASK